MTHPSRYPTITFRLSDELKTAVQQRALKQSKTVGQVVREYLQTGLQQGNQ